MNRYKGLMRDTWWLWLMFFATGIGLSLLANPLFLITIPVLVFACIYYGAFRYDDDGNPVGD